MSKYKVPCILIHMELYTHIGLGELFNVKIETRTLGFQCKL